MSELQQERQLSPLPPVVIGSVLVIPQGLLDRWQGNEMHRYAQFAHETARHRTDRHASHHGCRAEPGRINPRDVSSEKCGYDIESRDPWHRQTALHRSQRACHGS